VTNRVLAGEEKIEYRDEAGNILNEEQVKELEGKVSFSTRYETRTRLVDANGNEVSDGRVEEEEDSFAGTIAEGSNQETGGVGQDAANEQPASVNVNEDIEKEKSIEASTASAEPESDAGTATGRDEL
jgi:dolichyl-phosphate-mannose-protein mannosyltransferase